MPDDTTTQPSVSTTAQYQLEEYLNWNMHRQFPLADASTGVDQAGMLLPTSFLVALSMEVPAVPTNEESPTEQIQADKFFISAISRTGSVLSIDISYRTESDTDILCGRVPAVPLTAAYASTYTIYPLPVTDTDDLLKSALGQLTGYVQIGTCDDLEATGSYTFAADAAYIDSTCVHVYDNTGLTSISVDLGGGTVYTFTQNFIIRAGDGIQLAVDEDQDSGMQVLVINRQKTAGESQYGTVQDLIDAVTAKFGTPIKTINSAHPTTAGDITIVGKDCLSVATVEHGLIFNNPCSKPCCSDTDYQDAYEALKSLEDAKTRLLNYYETLSTNINAMQARLSSLLAARNGTSTT